MLKQIRKKTQNTSPGFLLLLCILVLVQAFMLLKLRARVENLQAGIDKQGVILDSLSHIERQRQEKELRMRQEHEERAARLQIIVGNQRDERRQKEKLALQARQASLYKALKEAESKLEDIRGFHLLRSKREKEEQISGQILKINLLKQKTDSVRIQLSQYE